MGHWFSSLFYPKTKSITCVILGLNDAGKTTIATKLNLTNQTNKQTNQNTNDLEVSPTIGFNYETFEKDNVFVKIWDLGGNTEFRNQYWTEMIKKGDVLIYVVDSTDNDSRVLQSVECFRQVLQYAQSTVTVIVLSNKIDIPDHRSLPKIAQLFDDDNRKIMFLEISAKTGQYFDQFVNSLVNVSS